MIGTPVQGTESLHGSGTVDILPAAGAASRYHIDRINISFQMWIDPALISVTDGTTVFVPEILGKDDNGMDWVFDFGPYGWVSALNAAITLVVETVDLKFTITGCTVTGRKVTD